MKTNVIISTLIFIVMIGISSAETLFSQVDGSGLTLVEKLDGKYYYYNDMIGRFQTRRFVVDGEPVAVAYHTVTSTGYVWSTPRLIIMWDSRKMAFAMGISDDGETVSSTTYIYAGTVWYEASQILSKCHKVPPNR